MVCRHHSYNWRPVFLRFEKENEPSARLSEHIYSARLAVNRVTGTPATKLLEALKEQVKPDKEFKEIGLTIYLSKDGLLNCDETVSTKTFCEPLPLPAPRLAPLPFLGRFGN